MRRLNASRLRQCCLNSKIMQSSCLINWSIGSLTIHANIDALGKEQSCNWRELIFEYCYSIKRLSVPVGRVKRNLLKVYVCVLWWGERDNRYQFDLLFAKKEILPAHSKFVSADWRRTPFISWINFSNLLWLRLYNFSTLLDILFKALQWIFVYLWNL